MSDEQYEALRKQYAELVNYISAMAREIGAFRQETNAKIDALTEKTDTLTEKTDALTEEFKQYRRETNERLVALEKHAKEIEYVLKGKFFDLTKFQAAIDEDEDRIRALEGEAA